MASLKDITGHFGKGSISSEGKGSSLSKQLGWARPLFVFDRVEIRTIILTRKEFIINIRPNTDDSDHIAN
jgi:hypothetical protein